MGTGGMSSVYRAHDRLLERHVAIKVLHEQFTADSDYVERFRREARAVAQLSHPNIVTVIDRGEHDDRQFIVFEYVDGENLKALVEREGPLPECDAIELALQVARALGFAHEQGLVHRDVKPQNVLLNDGGQAKVTDFGIARSLEVSGNLTQSGTVMGTSDYIAPEQARGSKVDAQSDVYSLGTVLYELLTGEVPFQGDNFVAVAMQHINQPPPSVRERRPELSPCVDEVVQRAMAKEPRDRFGSMDELCAALNPCLAELDGARGFGGCGDDRGSAAAAPSADGPPARRAAERVAADLPAGRAGCPGRDPGRGIHLHRLLAEDPRRDRWQKDGVRSAGRAHRADLVRPRGRQPHRAQRGCSPGERRPDGDVLDDGAVQQRAPEERSGSGARRGGREEALEGWSSGPTRPGSPPKSRRAPLRPAASRRCRTPGTSAPGPCSRFEARRLSTTSFGSPTSARTTSCT